MAEDDPLIEGNGNLPESNAAFVTMERIKELEKTIKAKDSDFQEKMVSYKVKINDLELDKRTLEKNLETLN